MEFDLCLARVGGAHRSVERLGVGTHERSILLVPMRPDQQVIALDWQTNSDGSAPRPEQCPRGGQTWLHGRTG